MRRGKWWRGCAQPETLTPRLMLNPAPWRARPISSGPAASSQGAAARSPASSGRSPRLSMNADTLALACASSPAMSTSSGRPWARTWPKTVLNAFTTCALAGAALAGDLLRAGSAVRGDQPGGVGVEGVGDVDDDLAGQRVPVLGEDRRGAGVGHGEDDDVAGRGGAECPGRGAAAEGGGQVLGLGLVAAGELDGVAALDRAGGYGAGHAPQADNADAAHGRVLTFCGLG